MNKIFHHTMALCGQCKAKVPARVVEKNEKIFLEKFCVTHGFSEAMISSDPRWYLESISYVKPRQIPLATHVGEFRGCPESCGSCREHQQHTCLPVIEITNDCNLSCPVCLKNLEKHFRMTVAEFEKIIDNLLRCEERIDVLNISGGEPTVHPQLEEFLRIAKARGVMQPTVSTNGVALRKNPNLRKIFLETGAIVALQFDSFEPAANFALRGVDHTQDKLELIGMMEDEGIRYSLVATIANGINSDEITRITDFFFNSKAVSMMFQPIALTGEAQQFSQSEKITIPDVVHAIERSPFVQKGDFNPLPCSHFSCFALAYYFIVGDGKFLSLKEFLGPENYLDVIANKTLPGLDDSGFATIRNRLYDVWSLADAGSLGEQALMRIQGVLRKVASEKLTPQKAFALGAESMKAIFIHDFMDVSTMDFGRLIKCCNPYPQTDGRLVPICAQNVFFQD